MCEWDVGRNRLYLVMPLKKLSPLLFAAFFLVAAINLSCKARNKPQKMIHGGCCVASGSSVMMGDGTTKLIENLKVHDTIMGFDPVKNIFLPSVVKSLASTEHEGFVRLEFGTLYRNGQVISAGSSLTLIQDHPVWVKGKGWCSNAPDMTKRIQGMSNVGKYDKDDFCYAYPVDSLKPYREIPIFSIEKVKGIIKAYTVVELGNKLDCFVVNGIVVGVEPRSMEQGGE